MNTTTIHAHVDTYSTDCDGAISRSYIMTPDPEELAGQDAPNWFGDIDFHNRVVAHVVNTYSLVFGGRLDVTKWDDGSVGLDWSEATEEGSRNVNARICEDPDCDTGEHSYRDHRAESMGY